MKILFMLVLLSFGHDAFASDTEECQLALVEEVVGNSILVAVDGKKSAVEAGLSLSQGDLLATGQEAWVDLRLCDGTGLRVGENAKFYHEGVGSKDETLVSWAFRLVRGSIFATVTGDGKGDRVKFRVRTPSAALGVRGTEFVIDANDADEGETSLHTVEGEVLVGGVEDFDKLGELRGTALSENFETVGKEKMSRIRKGEARPRPAAAYKLWEFRNARKHFFGRTLQKKDRNQLRDRFRSAHEKFRKVRGQRAIFERSREKMEERVDKAGEGARQLKENRLRRQEKAAARTEIPKERREKKRETRQRRR